MRVTEAHDLDLIAALQDGLPLVPRPYACLGQRIGLSEAEVIARLRGLIDRGVIRRFGVIVRHRALGYRANAMVVWDLPEAEVGAAGARLAALPYVTLCYRRPRRLPDWPYNLFCMIHGTDRDEVLCQVAAAARDCGLEKAMREVLFSTRCFKQRGARYFGTKEAAA
ncbi:MAG: AsnC family protein [Kiloniellales bacterium]|nr:AsnC family protein [Kiloniellales bacterium]